MRVSQINAYLGNNLSANRKNIQNLNSEPTNKYCQNINFKRNYQLLAEKIIGYIAITITSVIYSIGGSIILSSPTPIDFSDMVKSEYKNNKK